MIHPTAVIDSKASISKGVTIGAYSIVGPDVKIGKGTVLKSHVVIEGDTTIGENNTIYPFVSLGQQPQDLKFHGEKTSLVIGNDNDIREYVTMSPGTEGGGGITRIGDGNLFMVHSHIGHDAIIGSDNVLANGATVAGHVEIGSHVILGGLSAVRQFVRIGDHVMVGGMSGIDKDVPPFVLTIGNRATIQGLNLVGLRRRDFSKDDIRSIQNFYKSIYASDEGTLSERLASAKASSESEKHALTFMQKSEIGFLNWKPSEQKVL